MSTGLMTIDNVGRRGGEEHTLDLWKKAISASVALRNHNHRLDRMYNGVHFVHNGVISNYRQIKSDAIVDSECLGPLIHQRDISPAWGSVGLAWFEQIDGQWKMFVYRHQQSLLAAHGLVIGDSGTLTPAVLIASRQQHFPKNHIHNMTLIELKEGVAYEVTNDGLVESWHNQSSAKEFVRQTHRNGCYIGG